MRIAIYTLGCKVNQYETQAMETILRQRGHELVPFSEVAKPLLADGRFLQPHRSYVVSLPAVRQLTAGELLMASGARVPIPRGRESAVRDAIQTWFRG